jgi:hypothetical protein
MIFGRIIGFLRQSIPRRGYSIVETVHPHVTAAQLLCRQMIGFFLRRNARVNTGTNGNLSLINFPNLLINFN